MYGGGGGGSSDGDSHEGTAQRKIPAASSMLTVRNLRRFIGSGAGLGSEALMELETKRILLDVFSKRSNRKVRKLPQYQVSIRRNRKKDLSAKESRGLQNIGF